MDDADKRASCKIVLLGNSGVGKTSLVMKWTNGDFHRTIKPTIGANHQRKTVQISANEEIDLYLWDTAGQEQFQSLTPLYARSASCAIVVAAINDRESFEALEQWLKLLEASCDPLPPVILAVNKMDLMGQACKTQEEIEKANSAQFCGIFYVSAATGENVDNVFNQAAKSAYEFIKKVLDADKTTSNSVSVSGDSTTQGRGCGC